MRIALTSDHHGLAVRRHLMARLIDQGHEVTEQGATEGSTPVDYPPLVARVAYEVVDGHADRAIVVGGTGSGEHIAANKVVGIRAAFCQEHLTARISRENNDTNVLVLGAMVIGWRLAEELVDIWLTTEFTHGRHVPRLEQIAALERGERL